MWMAPAARSFCVVTALRLSPDSAGDKNTIANITASQQVRCAPVFNRFTSGLDVTAHDVDNLPGLASNAGRDVVVLSLAGSDFMVLFCSAPALRIFFLNIDIEP